MFDELTPAGVRIDKALHANMDYNASEMKLLTQNVDVTDHIGRSYIFGFICLAVVIAVVTGFFLVRSLASPIKLMTVAMTQLANGHLDCEIPGRDNKSEIGEMSHGVDVFKRNAMENRTLTAAQAKEQVAKDRRRAALDAYTQNFGITVSGVLENLSQSADKMNTAADEMSESARRTRNSTSSAVEGASASARNLNSVAVATEEMAANSKERTGRWRRLLARCKPLLSVRRRPTSEWQGRRIPRIGSATSCG